MAKGQDDPADRDDGRVLAPDELDIAADEHVAEIEDGRYVVSPDDPIDDMSSVAGSADHGPPTEPSSEHGPPTEPSPPSEHKSPAREPFAQPDRQPAPASESASEPELTHQRVHEWLSTELDESASRYGFDVTAKFDGPVEQRQMMSNDVVTIFESLILWYAQHIDTATPVEEVLGILLMESNVPIRYPPESLHRFVKSSGLSPDDTIADLIEAVDDEGVKF